MTSILIKSFNRPVYLDRCLSSIKRHIKGWSEICVLDDGTPAPLLDEVSRRHPEARIVRSPAWAQKAAAIEAGVEPLREVPTALWREAVASATDHFLMTEDDVWFTRAIDLSDLTGQARLRRIGQIRLGWLGKDIDAEYARTSLIADGLLALEPGPLILLPSTAMRWLFTNRFRLYSIAHRAGRVTEPSPRSYVPRYWVLNSISMALWDKRFWLAVWRGSVGIVDEEAQLRSAAAYYRRHRRNPTFFARVDVESARTTFQSAAGNGNHSDAFDIRVLNSALNTLWLSGGLDADQGLPGDLPFEVLAGVLPVDLRGRYREWVEVFKSQYRAQGCRVD